MSQNAQNVPKQKNVSILELINTFQTQLNIKDSEVKEILKDVKLPANVPKKFGGKAKHSNKVEGEPKRPSNAYIFFVNSNRSQLKEEFPEIKNTEVTKKLGKMWKETSETDREPFNKMAQDDKVRYQKEMKEFDPDYQSSDESNTTAKKTNGMILYQKKNGKGSWKNASDEEKSEYKNMAKEMNSDNGL